MFALSRRQVLASTAAVAVRDIFWIPPARELMAGGMMTSVDYGA